MSSVKNSNSSCWPLGGLSAPEAGLSLWPEVGREPESESLSRRSATEPAVADGGREPRPPPELFRLPAAAAAGDPPAADPGREPALEPEKSI